jgi:hypothetical protein
LLPEPEPLPLLPPELLPPLPDPLLPPELLPPLEAPLPPLDAPVEPAAPPPQFAHASANASALVAASPLLQKEFMPLLSQEKTGKIREVRSCPRRKRDMYS